MRRAAPALVFLLLAGLWAGQAAAQTLPDLPVPAVVSPAAAVPTVVAPTDTLKPFGAVADTVRRPALVPEAAEPSDKLTRPLALRITVAIVVLTLSTLLLYNVRSR